MKSLIAICLYLFVISCKEKPAFPAQEVKIEKIQPGDTSERNCYSHIANRDTIELQLSTSGSLAKGKLTYKIFEKDQNNGTIEGLFYGDTLKADYSFLSEGVTSVREVIFLKKDNNLIEGFGDVTEDNGKMIFKNNAKITFDEKMTLKAVECK